MKAPAFQFYAGDYFIDTFLWSNRELGAYTRLLSFEWTNGPLPNDIKKLAKIAVESPENMAKIWREIGVKFEEIDGNLLVNSRLEETRQKQINYAESRRKGAIAKHKKFVHMQKSCNDTDTQLCNDSPSPSPSPSQKKEEKKRSGHEKKTFPSDAEAYRLSSLLLDEILDNNPESRLHALNNGSREATIQTWAQDIDLLLRKDQREPSSVQDIIKYATSDNFWKANILSGKKLREKWDTLVIQKSSRPKKDEWTI